MPICTQCGTERVETEFNFKNKRENRRNVQCRFCTRKGTSLSYFKNREHYLRVTTQRKREYTKKILEYIQQYLSTHPCVDCGVYDPIVLQFDHVRGEKREAICILARTGYPISTIIAEIAKCDVRCANCHARKTAYERGYYTVRNRG